MDTGNVAAYEARVQYEVTMIKGFKNVLFGGEGLLNTRLTGPGKGVAADNDNARLCRDVSYRFLPKSSN